MRSLPDLTTRGIRAGDPAGCAAALNSLWSGSGRHGYLPAGEYFLEEPLRVPSGLVLELAPDAVLRLRDGVCTTPDDYLLCNADPEEGNADISITGGRWEGNQRGNPRPEGLFDYGCSGAMLHFRNVRNLTLGNLTLANAEAYYARFTGVTDFHIETIRFDSDLVRPNNDGIHLGGHCRRGVIRNLRALRPGVTGDDMVALNADDALARTEVKGMTRGPIEDLEISDIEAESCHTFVRVLSVASPIRNVRIRGIRGGCQVAAVNGDGARHCRVPVFDAADPRFADGVGQLEDLDIREVRVWKTRDSSNGLIDLQERMARVSIRDVVRDRSRDQAPASPTLRLKYLRLNGGTLNGQPLPVGDLHPPAAPFESHADRLDLTVNP